MQDARRAWHDASAVPLRARRFPGLRGILRPPCASAFFAPNPVPQAPADRSAELAAWLSRTALGDRAAFAALYRATSAHLFGVILRINRDRSQAEELLQDIYVNIWRAAGSFDAARAQPMTWLVSIARNRAIDSLRRAKSDVKTVSSHLAGEDGEADDDLVELLPSGEAGPLQLLEQAADARALAHCVQQLSAEQQQCVALAYYQGLSHAEVAEHLVQPLGTVKSWVRRALLALKQCLARAAGQAPSGGSPATDPSAKEA